VQLLKESTKENISIALRAIRSNFLRAALTILIISIGIMALVAMNTFVDAFKGTMNSQFARLGAGTIIVSSKSNGNRRHGVQQKAQAPLTYNQVLRFKKNFDEDAIVSVSSIGSFMATVKGNGVKTNPNITIIGCDENYLELSSYDLDDGRNFSATEVTSGQNSVILGADILKTLYKDGQNPIGEFVYLGSDKYYVIGVLASKGNTFGMASDNQVLITLGALNRRYLGPQSRYRISIRPYDLTIVDDVKSAIRGMMRIIRQDDFSEDDSFTIKTSDQMTGDLNSFLSNFSLAATIIGLITLMGAGIGLLNIMLVSVTERTKEIGVRKAIGASANRIRNQFLIEAIVIGQIGGVVGTILGVIIGNIIAVYLEFSFQIPWFWIFIGVSLTFITSVLSGYIPAKKASVLDPIEALRYE